MVAPARSDDATRTTPTRKVVTTATAARHAVVLERDYLRRRRKAKRL